MLFVAQAMEIIFRQAEMLPHTLMQQEVRLKQAVESFGGCGFATAYQDGAMKQLFVEFLDQFVQQCFLAINMVVNGADLDAQMGGQVGACLPG